MKNFSFKLVWKALKGAFKGFGDDKVTKLSASLAYYTVFSIAPLLILVIALAGVILGREAVEGTIFHQIRGFVGNDAAAQIQEIIKNAAVSGKGVLATVIGIVTLLIGATTVFGEIQDSINGIWGLKPKPKVGVGKLLMSRLLSFGLIATLGFLLLISVGVSALVDGIGDRLKDKFPDVTVVVFYIINMVLTLGITTVLFAVIFKVLPDAKFRWKNIWPGAIATSILFMLGRFLISLYISKSEVASSYGAAGSMVILLLWVYYSAIILYFGAEFTKSYAFLRGATIIPNKYAMWDHDNVIAGAKPKEGAPQAAGSQKSAPQLEAPHKEARHHHRHPVRHNKKKLKEAKPGMGTVLLGLVLYFFNTSKRS